MTVKLIRESVIEQELVLRAKAYGGRADKVVIKGSRGFFDRLVVLPSAGPRWPPRIIFVELKKPRGGVVSPQQHVIHAAYRALGCEVALVKNFEDIAALIGPPKK